jgi:hypothetical protein
VRLNILVSIGAIDLLRFYGRPLAQLYPLVMYSAAALWVLAMVALGIAARSGHRWAFLAGMVLYGANMIALIMMFSLWAFGVHAFFVFRWFQGQKALKAQPSRRFGSLTETLRLRPPYPIVPVLGTCYHC